MSYMKNNFKVSIPLAIIITLIAVIYQRSTGPTYPKKFDIGKDRKVRIKLPRSHGGITNAPVEVPALSEEMKATLTYKRYPTNDDWTTVDLIKEGSFLKTSLPHQPPAGKITYFLNLTYADGSSQSLGSMQEPIYIRFKGAVPTAILAPHVVFMFLSMLLSVVALVEAVFGTQMYKLIGRMTLSCLFVGGMILGPIVQKYAFGVYWAGFPFDVDLTDNKLLIGVVSWFLAVALSWKSSRKWPTIIAAIILFGVYSIPHSMQGSEFDYEKGKVTTDVD
jgi:hypothetical protein